MPFTYTISISPLIPESLNTGLVQSSAIYLLSVFTSLMLSSCSMALETIDMLKLSNWDGQSHPLNATFPCPPALSFWLSKHAQKQAPDLPLPSSSWGSGSHISQAPKVTSLKRSPGSSTFRFCPEPLLSYCHYHCCYCGPQHPNPCWEYSTAHYQVFASTLTLFDLISTE
jgi:hypothetical protein